MKDELKYELRKSYGYILRIVLGSNEEPILEIPSEHIKDVIEILQKAGIRLWKFGDGKKYKIDTSNVTFDSEGDLNPNFYLKVDVKRLIFEE
jgi:hypothetical protein